jgi:tetratricopeptide (TPR) repeat protein
MGSDEVGFRPWAVDRDVMAALRLEKAQAAFTAQELDRALVECEELLDLAPRNIEALRLIGQIAQQLGDAALAVEAWEQVLELRPGELPAMISLAQARFEMVDYAGAAALAADVVRLDTTQADGWFTLAQARERLGQHEEALVAFQRAWTLDPTHYNVPMAISERTWQTALLSAMQSLAPGVRDFIREARLEWAELPSVALLTREAPPINPFIEVLFDAAHEDATSPERILFFRGNLGRPYADGRKLADRIAAAIELESAAWLPPDEEGG